MPIKNAHPIIDDATDAGDCDLKTLAWVHYAKPEDAAKLLAIEPDPTSMDTRSDWVWVRLRDGTLMLATFPQGDIYMQFSDADVAPFGAL